MKRTAEELAKAIGATVEGDGTIEVSGVAAPEQAGEHDLIYVGEAKHAARAETSRAVCVIADPTGRLTRKTILRSAQPKLAFAKAAAVLVERAQIATAVHATAVVAASARVAAGAGVGPYAVIGENSFIGKGTQIGAHSVIGDDCWIGENCRIHTQVSLYNRVRVGHRAEIHSGAVLGADGFGYAHGEGRYWKFPQAGIVEIGDDVEIGANTTIDRGSLDDTRIAEGVKIDNLVHVGHNVQIGAHTVIAAQTGISGSCVFGKNVVIGAKAGFSEHCRLEDGAVIGGQSGVLGGKTIRAGDTVWGTPARSMDKFKETYVWHTRLPELAARIKWLEVKIGGK